LLCSAKKAYPNIILIHDESAAPPWIYPNIKYDKTIDSYFHSSDGTTHLLQLEVFGAGSHMSIFSVMLGLSARYFGEFAYMVTDLVENRFTRSLPDVLKSCGYRTGMIYPFLHSFGRDVRLYDTIGFDRGLYLDDLGFESYKMRDKVYYDRSLKYIEEERSSNNSPTFLFLHTMNLHPPYTSASGSGKNVKINLGDVDAYLENLKLAQFDFENFRLELARQFPRDAFLIIRYGDHQPQAFEPYARGDAKVAPEIKATVPDHWHDKNISPDRLADLEYNDRAERISYWAFDAINYDMRPIPSFDLLNVAYLSTVILIASGVDLPDDYEQRLALMRHCNGRSYTCPHDAPILQFHKRLIDSGLLGTLKIK
jgi:phosphoglycerol transferase MdoB-like AlkP superfamily enzyme